MRFDQIYGHESQIKSLRESISLGRVPHAQLFTGPEGVGMLAIAIAFMRAVFCQEPNADKSSCDLKFDRLTHPDLHFIFPVAANSKVKPNRHQIIFYKTGVYLSKTTVSELCLIGTNNSKSKTNRVKSVF